MYPPHVSCRYLTLNAEFGALEFFVSERIVSFQSATYIQALNGEPPYDDGRYRCTLSSGQPIEEGVEYYPLTDFESCSLVSGPMNLLAICRVCVLCFGAI